MKPKKISSVSGLSKDQIEAVKLLKEYGLKFISSPLQLEHGTLYFEDTKMNGIFYSITASGYARRHDKNSTSYGYSPEDRSYQLNKTIRTKSSYPGDSVSVSRILKPGQYFELAKDIVRAIEMYRGREWNKSYMREYKNNIKNMRAKTINEDIYADDQEFNSQDNELKSQLNILFQQAAEKGIDFDSLKEIIDEALNEIDWTYAKEQYE